MPIKNLFAAAALALAAAPSLAAGGLAVAPAQAGAMAPADRHGDDRQTASEANRTSLETARMRQRGVSLYEHDRRAFRMAVARRYHRRAMNRYDRRLMRQEKAYAAAMAAWRRQASACRHGDHRACRAHAPRVASFY